MRNNVPYKRMLKRDASANRWGVPKAASSVNDLE